MRIDLSLGRLILIGSCALFTACGEGPSGASNEEVSSAGGSVENPVNTSNTNGNNSSDACLNMNRAACEVFHLTNIERERAGVPLLEALKPCIDAAQFHAEDMFTNNYFSHHSPTETYIQRFRRFGVTGVRTAENIARATQAAHAVTVWMNSESHRNNMLSPTYKYLGVGQESTYWVQCFSD